MFIIHQLQKKSESDSKDFVISSMDFAILTVGLCYSHS